jgi:hypothetical protein
MTTFFRAGTSDEMAALYERLTRMDRMAPLAGSMPALDVRYPWMALLDPLDARRLVCGECNGGAERQRASTDGDPTRWPCDGCGGTGLRCPVCCGARWLRTATPCAGATHNSPLIMRCLNCDTVAGESTTIVQFIVACREGAL